MKMGLIVRWRNRLMVKNKGQDTKFLNIEERSRNFHYLTGAIPVLTTDFHLWLCRELVKPIRNHRFIEWGRRQH